MRVGCSNGERAPTGVARAPTTFEGSAGAATGACCCCCWAATTPDNAAAPAATAVLEIKARRRTQPSVATCLTRRQTGLKANCSIAHRTLLRSGDLPQQIEKCLLARRVQTPVDGH